MMWYRYDGFLVELHTDAEHTAEWLNFPDTTNGIVISEEKDRWIEQGILQGWLTTTPPILPEQLSL